jgi:hypothetical protein
LGRKPPELESDKGRDIWDTITAAAAGDTPTLQRLLARDPGSSQAEYWYTQPIHFAVRAGHLDTVQILLESGADPEWNGYHDGSLLEMARDRGHERIAQLLEEARNRRGRVAPAGDHPIHVAAQADDIEGVRKFLDDDSNLLERGDRSGGTPLHRAVLGSARRVIEHLLDGGANIHAVHSVARGGSHGLWALALQAIDLAIWGSNTCAPPKRDFQTARLLLARGAAWPGLLSRYPAGAAGNRGKTREKRRSPRVVPDLSIV